MDAALKARLIGAAVLVAIAVILVPELLSGRHVVEAAAGGQVDRGLRQFTITPDGAPVVTPQAQSRSDAEAQPEPTATLADNHAASVAAAAGATTPAPTASAAAPSATPATAQPPPQPAAPVSTPVVAAPPPSSAPAAAPPSRTPAPPAEAHGAWAVQVGAFGSTQAADKVVQDLRSAGFRAYLSPVQRSGKTLFRVRVGPEPERARADALAATLKGRGFPATVVAND